MPEMLPQIIMIVALFAIMYFMLIRPQKKKDDEIRKMRDSLKVGDEILTIGGIYGKIVRIKDDRLTIQVGSDRTKIDVAKWAINNLEKGTESKGSKDASEDKKVTPKNMKKLGEKAEAEVEEAVAEVQEDAQE
ncbi:MAG: preprotein translocase subunit YajC [Firmicutes bacterium]|nr:preprotein translocase subunit YajC [Bacillota bacterium]MBQ6294757.1 preprotein translocase subunit YajC [Bacillota bacterium]MBR0209273.1 preprotein translocase subunit YajC [Bacillota bacterium]MBR0517446.1 preprotein translocase subunit YajC [Bacillota bacterium]MBR3035586.1 preprotein translocase subunit YajC [Bacillota bacterium]